MPARLFLSSGDLVADRRFEFARDLQLGGDLTAAAELLEQAIELAPNFATAWFTLGEIREELGDNDKAVAAFRKAREADPQDRHGASVRLMRLGAEELSLMPRSYVQTLFDQYAPRFEDALLGDLDYRAPQLLFKAVIAVRVAQRKPAFFKRAIDLGCGTGLGAAAFAKQLEVEDMVAGLVSKSDGSADLVLAADAFCYVPELTPVLTEVTRVLAPGGLIAFTVETHDCEGVVIGEGLRYAHAAEYIRRTLAAVGLKLAHLEQASPRTEDNKPVQGLVVVASKT